MIINHHNIANKLLVLIAIIAPAVAVFSGMGILPVLVIGAFFPLIIYIKNRNFSLNNSYDKAAIIFFVYAILSAIWSIDYTKTLPAIGNLMLIYLAATVFLAYIEKTEFKFINFIIIGTVLGIILAGEEIITNGYIYRTVKGTFDIWMLNRGTTFLVISFFVCMLHLIKNRKFFSTAILTIFLLLIIFCSDGQSSMLGIACGIMTWLAALLLYKKFQYVFITSIIIVSFALPITAKNINAHKIVEQFPELSVTAQHRIYIWNFAAEKAFEKPLLGWGFNSSRVMPDTEKNSIPIYCENDKLTFVKHSDNDKICELVSPLPLHPHNMILQIFLELGILGLIIFLWFNVAIIDHINKMNFSRIENATAFAIYAAYLSMSSTAFGIWQSWWIASIILIIGFFKNCLNSNKSIT